MEVQTGHSGKTSARIQQAASSRLQASAASALEEGSRMKNFHCRVLKPAEVHCNPHFLADRTPHSE